MTMLICINPNHNPCKLDMLHSHIYCATFARAYIDIIFCVNLFFMNIFQLLIIYGSNL